jgi:hypothetical protein
MSSLTCIIIYVRSRLNRKATQRSHPSVVVRKRNAVMTNKRFGWRRVQHFGIRVLLSKDNTTFSSSGSSSEAECGNNEQENWAEKGSYILGFDTT